MPFSVKVGLVLMAAAAATGVGNEKAKTDESERKSPPKTKAHLGTCIFTYKNIANEDN